MLFFLFLSVASGEICGKPPICNCNIDLGILSCYGKNVSDLPVFPMEIKTRTLFLDIVNTNITKFLPVQDWTNLQWITLRGNKYLNCGTIKVDTERVYVDSDCPIDLENYSDKENLSEGYNFYEMLYALIMLPVGLSLASGYVYYVKKKEKSMLSRRASEPVTFIEKKNLCV